MPSRFDEAAYTLGRHLPSEAMRRLGRASLAGWNLALCLHRVAAKRRARDPQPQLTIEPATLDALIATLVSFRPDASERWLSVTFDDGYEDAARYLLERAPQWPGVEFLFFICPEKTQKRVGFRWDLSERGTPLPDGPVDIAGENERAALQGLADQADFRLAEVGLLEQLARLPNVALGNHTNGHHQQTRLSQAQAAEELRRSHQAFTSQFGAPHHFAFPFGTPEHEFNRTHVEILREQGPFLIWSTEGRPYRPKERRPSAVLPRFPVDGSRSSAELAGWIVSRAALARLRKPKAEYP